MQCFISPIKNIYFNLALEDYLLMHGEQDFFVLWQSSPAVVVGKHQNTLAEINYRFVRENHIQVARRLSGGGTVFHDEGNLNFTYVSNGEAGKLVDFRRFIEPVIGFLHSLGISAQQGIKNEILAGGRKISGNAEHVYKNRVLHHGTLLFHSNLHLLRESIRVVPGKYTDKAVQSNRSEVINIAELLDGSMDILTFSRHFLDYMLEWYGGNRMRLNPEMQLAVENLASSRYRTWGWIYGWSPDYELHNVYRSGDVSIGIYLKVHRGIITDCDVRSDHIPGDDLVQLRGLLPGCEHDADRIEEILGNWSYLAGQYPVNKTELVYSFF
jgi:lipoate---protein ligase